MDKLTLDPNMEDVLNDCVSLIKKGKELSKHGVIAVDLQTDHGVQLYKDNVLFNLIPGEATKKDIGGAWEYRKMYKGVDFFYLDWKEEEI